MGQLQGGGRRSGGLTAPEEVDQPVERHHPFGLKQQHRQHRLRHARTEGDDTVPVERLDRAKDPELHADPGGTLRRRRRVRRVALDAPEAAVSVELDDEHLRERSHRTPDQLVVGVDLDSDGAGVTVG